MIVAEQKPMAELKKMMKGKKKVLAVGCGTCLRLPHLCTPSLVGAR